jgi:hypothetical protein
MGTPSIGITDEPVTWHPPTDLLHGLDLPSRDPASVDISLLHQLIRQDRHRLTAAAERLNVILDDVRHALERHPAPAATPPPRRRTGATPFAYRSAKSALPREKLVELYHGERNSLRNIGASIGVSRQTITRLARDYGIPLRELGRSATYDIDGDWLYDEYVAAHSPNLVVGQALPVLAGRCQSWWRFRRRRAGR